MMHVFLENNRQDLIERCRAKVALRPGRAATAQQLQNGVPLFLEQLIATLSIEQTTEPMNSRKISGPSGGGAALSEMGVSAAQHGRELLDLGFTVDQVVHDYGDLCQAITDLAYERDAPFLVDEFRTLNRCLDNAIADAVTEFSYQRDFSIAAKRTVEINELFGSFAQELHHFMGTAMLAFTAAKSGHLSLSGATGSVLERSLVGLSDLIDGAMADAGMAAENIVRHEIFSVAVFVAEVKHAVDPEARTHGHVLTVSAVDARLAVRADRALLFAAVRSLLQNAFQFAKPHTEVILNAYAIADHILIDVIDHRGDPPPDNIESMSLPGTQIGETRTGLGPGLSVARRGVELNDGVLSVRDVPGTGCIFTIRLPRYAMTGA
jgi:signal transduction histidine kinase